MPSYTLTLLPDQLAICRLPANAAIPPWAMSALAEGGFGAITRTREELSVVCAQRHVPLQAPAIADAPDAGLRVDADWRAFHVQGPFAFTEVGVLARLTTALANADIGLFAISTFDTDYLLVKAGNVDAASHALTAAGHTVETNDA